METANPETDPVVQAFSRELRRRLGPRLLEMRLFGSRARGDARTWSDYDVLVIVDRRTAQLREDVLDVEVWILDRYDALVASIVRSEEEWRRREGSPLAKNIDREGVAL